MLSFSKIVPGCCMNVYIYGKTASLYNTKIVCIPFIFKTCYEHFHIFDQYNNFFLLEDHAHNNYVGIYENNALN